MERVRSDDEIADAWVVGEHDLDGSRGAASACALIEDVGDGLRRERVAAMGLGDRGIEIGGADPDRIPDSPEAHPERRLDRRGPVGRVGDGEPPAQILRPRPEGIVEGVEPPDRPADLGAERAQRSALAVMSAGTKGAGEM